MSLLQTTNNLPEFPPVSIILAAGIPGTLLMIVNMANLRLNRKLKLSSCLVLIAIMMFDGFKFLIESRLDE